MQSQSSFRLRQSSLSTLPSHIEIPQYDASKVTTGIVHIGVGGFHRSHEAMYVNNYMNQTGDLSWGICGVGLRDADKKMQDTLVSQDYLYSLVEKHPSGERKVSVIGAICDFMMATENPEAVIDKMSSEDVKIVSLTITEGGYNFDPVTGEFIADNPDVLHDIANPTAPKLVFGYLLAALKARKDAGIKPFTIMSCDNIQHNGDVLKAMVLAYINLVDTAFAQWVEENVAFPNSMVDRITPATTQDDIAELASLGIETRLFNAVLAQDELPPSDLVRLYQSRGADPVRCDADGLRSDGYDVTQAPLQGVRPTATLRHDSRSLALAVMRFYRSHRRERDQ